MTKKEYTNGDITVIWQPGLCIHSAVCFHNLPQVFKPRDRPWIQMEHDTTEAITATVNACPSGALSIKVKPDQPISEPATPVPLVKIMQKGPVRIPGPCQIVLPDGTVVEKPNGVSICRCGGSTTYPFCDSSHKTNGFAG